MAKLYATIGDQKFELKPTFPRFAAIGLAAAQRSGDEMRATEAMWRLCRALVVDWNAFDEFMTEHDECFDELDGFIDAALRAYGLGPTDGSSDSSTSSEPTRTTSRVVSLQEGTVQVVSSEDLEDDLEDEQEDPAPAKKPSTRKRSKVQ